VLSLQICRSRRESVAHGARGAGVGGGARLTSSLARGRSRLRRSRSRGLEPRADSVGRSLRPGSCCVSASRTLRPPGFPPWDTWEDEDLVSRGARPVCTSVLP
jgi:hypothetical protein